MSDHYLKLIREELRSVAHVQIPPLRLMTVFQLFRKTLSGVHLVDEVGEEVVRMLLDRAVEDAKFLAKIRFLKTVLQKQVETGSVDSEIAKALIAILKAEESLLSPVVLRWGERMFYFFTSNCNLGEKVYRRGELALLTLRELILAEVSECGATLLDPIYRAHLSTQG